MTDHTDHESNKSRRSTITEHESSNSRQSAITEHVLDEHRPRNWRAPILISFGLFTGIDFALGHHFFYNSINGRAVDEMPISQSWIFRIGTLLALLTKLSWVLSISTAYIQLQWHKTRHDSLSVQNVDALSSVLGNILSFFDGTVFYHFPSLTLLALACWIFPIVPVITPGTINVVQSLAHNVTQLHVAQPNFYNRSFVWHREDMPSLEQGVVVPVKPMSKIAMLAGLTGQTVSCTPTFTNSSYELQFNAPAFKCQDADADVVSKLSIAYGHVAYYDDLGYSSYTSYVSTAGPDSWTSDWNRSIVNLNQPVISSTNLDTVSIDGTYLWIMTNDGTVDGQPHRSGLTTVNATQCSLFNATYTAKFDFVNGEQSVNVVKIDVGASLSIGDILTHELNGINTVGPVADSLGSYTSLAGSLGQLLVGYKLQANGPSSFETSIDSLALDVSNIGPEVESLFHKIVLSTFCEPELAIDSSLVNVTVSSIIQQYSYRQFDLILTYAVALAVTLLCSVVGIYIFYKSGGASFQNSFSSFLRASSGSNVHSYIQANDTGADPRPKTLAKVKIDMD